MNDFIPGISYSIDNTLGSLGFFLPEIVLVIGFLVVIISDLFLTHKNKQICFILTLITLLIAGFLSFTSLNSVSASLFGGMIRLDHQAILFKLLICAASILFVLFVRFNKALQSTGKGTGDMHSILLAVHLGLSLMVMSANLLMIYLSVEMVSVGSYLMVGYSSRNAKQSEAAMKYALFGAVCSAIMLYGISLLYGFTGTLDLGDPSFISGILAIQDFSWGLAIVMVLVGIAFKLSLVPFHFWSPDVYEGAPTPVTAFLSTAPKIAGFALLINFLWVFQPMGVGGLSNSLFNFNSVLGAVAILSMVIGNFGAIWQNNVKRMLAYSSIGHTGFMLMTLFVFSESGFKALIFYMAIYVIMNMAAFMMVDEIEERSGQKDIDGYKGFGKYIGLLMTGMVIVLISLTGLPPTAGFTAKFLVFSAAWEAFKLSGSPILMAMIMTGAISTVISLFYYFKIPMNAFLRDSESPSVLLPVTPKTYLSLFLVFLLILFMIFPSLLLRLL
ncbi:MAG: NADH-quinone oxidoreductase subunit N [Daejeonella sp.]